MRGASADECSESRSHPARPVPPRLVHHGRPLAASPEDHPPIDRRRGDSVVEICRGRRRTDRDLGASLTASQPSRFADDPCRSARPPTSLDSLSRPASPPKYRLNLRRRLFDPLSAPPPSNSPTGGVPGARQPAHGLLPVPSRTLPHHYRPLARDHVPSPKRQRHGRVFEPQPSPSSHVVQPSLAGRELVQLLEWSGSRSIGISRAGVRQEEAPTPTRAHAAPANVGVGRRRATRRTGPFGRQLGRQRRGGGTE